MIKNYFTSDGKPLHKITQIVSIAGKCRSLPPTIYASTSPIFVGLDPRITQDFLVKRVLKPKLNTFIEVHKKRQGEELDEKELEKQEKSEMTYFLKEEEYQEKMISL